MPDKRCIVCNGNDKFSIMLHCNEPKPADSPKIKQPTALFKYLSDGESAHLECYIQLCIDKELSRDD